MPRETSMDESAVDARPFPSPALAFPGTHLLVFELSNHAHSPAATLGA
jgi:hypothetical protein